MDMKDQRVGIEVELTGITREAATKIAAEYFGSSSHYDGTCCKSSSFSINSKGKKIL